MRWRPWVLTIAVLAAVGLGVVSETHSPRVTAEVWPVPDSTLADVDAAFRLAPSWVKQPTGIVQAGILPHHALVSPILAAWFVGLASQPRPRTVVIIGPDHQNAGAGYITTAGTSWQTPDGVVQVNHDLVTRLVETGNAVLDPALIRNEHGVYTAISYIHRTWTEAKIVTLAVKGDLRPDRLQRLARELHEFLGPNDLVIATVDFSHNQPTREALIEDEKSLEVIRRGDAAAALNIPVDSPPAISLVLRFAQLRQLNFQQLVHTTSAEFSGQSDASSTTSYLSAYFER